MLKSEHTRVSSAVIGTCVMCAVVLLAGCGTNPSGLTKAEAEALLRRDGYTDLAIGGAPEGWSGMADSDGHTFKVVVGKGGIVTAQP